MKNMFIHCSNIILTLVLFSYLIHHQINFNKIVHQTALKLYIVRMQYGI